MENENYEIIVENLSKIYGNKKKNEAEIVALKDASFKIKKGELVVILGPSGAGKSTLLNILGGMDRATRGTFLLNNKDVTKMNEKELAEYRRYDVGFVFQFYNLIPNLTVYENIQVCENLTSKSLNIDELLETLGMTEHKNKFPSELSGGQQQRCAIARALVKNPKILLCDEPTGALDSKTSKEILMLLEKVNKVYGTTMIIVTHNTTIKDMVHKVIKIKDGIICEDYNNEKIISAKDIEW